MPEPDEWLMMQVRNGHTPSLEVLVRRYAHSVLTFTTRLLGSKHGGEEAFQEVFLAIWTKRSSYLYPRYFRPWLFRIAHNKCRELQRRYRPPTTEYLDSAESADAVRGGGHSIPSPPEAAIAVETTAMVETALHRLSDQQRAIVVLRLWNDMSYSEIAESLDLFEGTVRSNMHYALAAIRRYLEPRLR